MITSRQVLCSIQKSQLREQSSGGSKVWRNPSKEEFLELLNSSVEGNNPTLFNFSANAKTKTVYVWNGGQVDFNQLKELLDSNVPVPYICKGVFIVNSQGVAVMQNIENIDSLARTLVNLDTLEYKKTVDFLNQFFSYQWTWLDAYLQKTSLLLTVYLKPLFIKNQIH